LCQLMSCMSISPRNGVLGAASVTGARVAVATGAGAVERPQPETTLQMATAIATRGKARIQEVLRGTLCPILALP
jgi:hypothetical protein